MECELCQFQGSEICKKCLEDNTLISISDLRELLNSAKDELEYREYTSRSWGDTRPDYEYKILKFINLEKIEAKIKDFINNGKSNN